MIDTELAVRPPVSYAPSSSMVARAADLATQFQTTAAESDRAGAFPADEFRMLASEGLLAAPIPEVYGGAGLDGRQVTLRTQLQLLSELGRGNLAAGRVYEGHVNALMLIATFGTPAQIDRWANDVVTTDLLFAVWNTEANDGVRIVPRRDGRFILEGSKTFCSGAGYVQRPIVPGALPDGGWQMTVVPMERVSTTIDPSWWQPLGMRGSASYRVDFTGVILEPDDLLGAPGDYHRQPWLSAGSIRFAAVQLGGAEALLDATRAMLQGMGRTDDPYQQHRIGEMAIAIESGYHWLLGASEMVDLSPGAGNRSQHDIERTLSYAHMTRLAIERICLDVMERAERSAGARAMLAPHPIERIIRDLTLYLRQPAPDAALETVGRFALDHSERTGALWQQRGSGRAEKPS